ncbi:MAG: SpoIIE family protein phosphatase [Candidatus Riflebacteria bacterium]|nr:SpoIIE family protein phosphatase [Candidatus Riflebacteria bacterium]
MSVLPLFLCIAAMLTHFILGMLVIIRSPGKSSNQLFSLILLLFFFWALAEGAVLYTGLNRLTLSLLFTPPVLLAYFFSIFSAVFPAKIQDSIVVSRRKNRFLLLIPVLLLSALLWSGKLVCSVIEVSNGFFFSFGFYEFPVKAVIITFLLITLINYSNSWKRLGSEFHRQRLKYVFAGLILPVAAGSVFAALSRIFGEAGSISLYTYGLFPGLSIAMAFLIAYSMLKYKLLDVDIICTIGLVYTLLSVILAATLELLENLLQGLLQMSNSYTAVLSTLCIAAIFSPLKTLLGYLVDKIFGRKTFDSHLVLTSILKKMRNCRNVNEVSDNLLKEISEELGCKSVALIIPAWNLKNSSPQGLLNDESDLNFNCYEYNDLEAIIEAAMESRITDLTPYFRLQEMGFKMAFPITSASAENKIAGSLFLGSRVSGLPYSESEQALLNGICSEIIPILNGINLANEVLLREISHKQHQSALEIYSGLNKAYYPQTWMQMPVKIFTRLSSTFKGDFVDVHESGKCGYIALCDAFNDGLRAAITLHGIYSALRVSYNSDDNDIAIKIKKLNSMLNEFSNPPLRSALTLIDIINGKLRIINAGNPFPVLITKSGKIVADACSSKPLGLESELSCAEKTLNFADFEYIFAYSNGTAKVFGDENGEGLMKAIDSLSPEELLFDNFFKYLSEKIALESHSGDDISFVLLGKKLCEDLSKR